ncbi:MAG: TdeIII family type II restriction endonuclease, partial [Candidatus Parcubacteria bacterium]|nr:TdeIII family type II restriction endonuclease [Candidatus Parcubacteria bacterium]
MTNAQEMKLAIQVVIKEMMDRIMHKVLVEDPFIKEDHRAEKPLYAALVPDEIFKGSHFERRFVTPFGSAWEKLAIVAANKGLGFGDKGASIKGQVNAERLRRIQEILNNLYIYRKRPDANYDPAANGAMAWDLYRAMWGSHGEFVIDGNLASVEYEDRLPSLRVPTLITVGDHDECDPSLAVTMH